MDAVLLVAGSVLAALLLRVVWGFSVWFLSSPESLGGWFLRGGIVWLVARAMGLA